METEVKEEIKFTPVGAGILVEWKQSESKLSLPPEVLKDIEMAENGIVKVIEVGPEVKQIKPNDYVLVWTTTPWTLPGNIPSSSMKRHCSTRIPKR